MAHNHTHDADTGNIKVAFLLNVTFTILEIAGGVLINSIAVLSDALHDLGDSISLGLAWFLARYSEKGSDERYSYGYRRFSLLGAFINAAILIGGSLFVLSEAIPRLLAPAPFNAGGMVLFALVGIGMNGFAAWRLRGSGSANAQVVGWHLLEDVLGWVAVLLVGIVALFVDMPILDPILSILITLYILANVLARLRSIAQLFLQSVPQQVNLGEIRKRLEAIPGVCSTHHVHIWSLDGEHNVLTAHLVVDGDTSREETIRIKRQATRMLDALDLELEHLTLEIEYVNGDCSMESDHPRHR